MAVNSATAIDSDTIFENYVSTFPKYAEFSNESLTGVMKSATNGVYYGFWKNTYSNVMSFNISISAESDADSYTGFKENYADYNVTNIGSKTVNTTEAVFCYSFDLGKSVDRMIIRQAKTYATTADPIGKEFTFNSDDTVATKDFKTIQVTDKTVSYFNIQNGNSELLNSLGLITTTEYFQEHYVAFNFSIDIDEICAIQIQSGFDTVWGDTHKIFTGVVTEDTAFVWSKLSFTDFPAEDPTTNHGSIPSQTFDIVPEDCKYSSSPSICGIPWNKTAYSFNTIIDCKNDDFSDDFKKIYDGDCYNSLSDVIKPNGILKYRWFVRFAESKVNWNTLYHGNNLVGYQSFCVNKDLPFMKGKDTTIISLKYKKNGETYKSIVADTPMDSTTDPQNPFNPATDDTPEWLTAVIVICCLLGIIILGMLVKPVGYIIKYVFLGIWWIFKIAVEILWILLIWWWVAIIDRITGNDPPRVWIWADKDD